ncbi:MAG: methylmalonyl-CoA mutase family protein [Acidimicrobiales bacterium]|nr:methylmalonyl-CoA mutase family protein [Acidimicrobiales bacterium]MDP6298252.1 methylmalonyl-CoA mutase family protein [Acidimicrobiales bacterium]HJM29024.1 methylmalonyl-CoA mutase family protein [Acidimicrobiales bacterium]HJM98367.1 methylmalonyl-CoA mutase family protein [Acidimicrobiales bacterium]
MGTEESSNLNPKETWQLKFEKAKLRDIPFETMSGVPVEPVYGEDLFPGQYPYTRGIYPSMYRSRLWTMRMFAGFGTAEDTNMRFKELLRNGGTGLSTAFDMPTLMGRDSDSEWSLGEVGRAGVAIDTLSDMEDLFADIDLSKVSTSMTINGPAATLLAMYVAIAEKNSVSPDQLAGTIQNDILKEYQAQKEYIYPPRPSMRIVTDMVKYTTAEMPKWHPISISGYHIREAGSTAAQELAFTLANGFAYVEAAIAAGQNVDEFGRRLSFFFNSHSDFFEEIGKFRAARRIWARWMKERYGATDERAMFCRFHTQTAGVSLTAQQPEINIARVGIQALAAALGGTQSLHTDSFDEALALPSEEAARIALRTQQIVAHETGVTNVADPLGGAPYVEWMTDEMERQAEAIFAHLEDIGNGSILEGTFAGIENGYFVGEIADAAYRFEREVNAGRRIIVGVNDFTEGDNPEDRNLLRIGAETEEYQLKRLQDVKSKRNQSQVDAALMVVTEVASDATRNLMPAIIDAVKTYATEEEIAGAMETVFGTYVERAIV